MPSHSELVFFPSLGALAEPITFFRSQAGYSLDVDEELLPEPPSLELPLLERESVR